MVKIKRGGVCALSIFMGKSVISFMFLVHSFDMSGSSYRVIPCFLDNLILFLSRSCGEVAGKLKEGLMPSSLENTKSEKAEP